MPSPLPCCPVICEYSWSKTQIEKKLVVCIWNLCIEVFLNLMFWRIRMTPVTICPWFGSVNGDVVQLQFKLFILSKMSLVYNVFINSLWLNILDRIVLVNWNLFCFVELCRYAILQVFIIYYFTNVHDIHAFSSICFGFALVVYDAGGL